MFKANSYTLGLRWYEWNPTTRVFDLRATVAITASFSARSAIAVGDLDYLNGVNDVVIGWSTGPDAGTLYWYKANAVNNTLTLAATFTGLGAISDIKIASMQRPIPYGSIFRIE
jgi:hypothetical protein